MSLSVRRRFCGNCPKGLTYIVAESYPNCNRILRYFQKIVIIRECPASVAKKRRYSRYSPYMLANALKCSRIRQNAHFFAAWNGTAESKKRIGHPAPFPKELPYRCIKMFSYEQDIVFDPFAGSGTTLIVAEKLNRKGVGVEIDATYCELAKTRIIKENGLLLNLQ